jgi:arabinose-5-phosphate isomerase
MPDMFDGQKRSEIMSKVHGANTTPEIRVRKLLHSMGCRFRLQRRDLPGNPDIVLPKYKTVIFVHGCFWHGCPNCARAKVRPVSNAEYWEKKLNRTLERDKNNVSALKKMDWRVVVVWECETRKTVLPVLKEKLTGILSDSGPAMSAAETETPAKPLPWEREGVACGDDSLLRIGRAVLLSEAEELTRAAGSLDMELVRAARAVYGCRGRVVAVGVGKSGHIGRKVAATLASLGTPSFFLHAAEGSHGDLGMVRREDVGLFFSNSGETPEILAVLPYFKRLGTPLIAVTGNPESALARHADIVVVSEVRHEADPLQLAPTSSATLQMVLGDALAGMATHLRGLRREDFAAFHPGGTLGRRLLTRVADVMDSSQLPRVPLDVSVREALFEITDKKYGATCVVNEAGELAGIFTDGDLRRLLERSGVEALHRRIGDCMTRSPATIGPDRLAAEAVKIMEEREISVLIVVKDGGKIPVGMLHFHELLKNGLA